MQPQKGDYGLSHGFPVIYGIFLNNLHVVNVIVEQPPLKISQGFGNLCRGLFFNSVTTD